MTVPLVGGLQIRADRRIAFIAYLAYKTYIVLSTDKPLAGAEVILNVCGAVILNCNPYRTADLQEARSAPAPDSTGCALIGTGFKV
jgi:hypothetical protein